MSEACAARAYRPRDPGSTPLYRLVETFYEDVKGQWEERFERLYGRCRGFLDRVVSSYVDCGNSSCGFARARCPECAAEFLVAFSCQTRSFCSSCAAKRATIFGAVRPFQPELAALQPPGADSSRDPLIDVAYPLVVYERADWVVSASLSQEVA